MINFYEDSVPILRLHLVLIVVSIIGTIIANVEFVIKLLRRPGVFHHIDHCIKITLALGSVLLASFYYVVWAFCFFRLPLPCALEVLALVYGIEFFPFVYGWGLFLLGLNLWLSQYNFHTPASTWNPKFKSLAIASISWSLGLVVICPLAYLGAPSLCVEFSWNKGRMTAITVVANLVPGCVVFLSSFFFGLTGQLMIHRHHLQDQRSGTEECHYQELAPLSHAHRSCPPVERGHQQQNNDGLDTIATMSQDAAREKRYLVLTGVIFFVSVVPYACVRLVIALHNLANANEVSFHLLSIIAIVCHWLNHLFPIMIPIVWRCHVR